MRTIRCRACGNVDGFTVVVLLHVVVDVDKHGEQLGRADYANEAGPRSITCSACGHSWRTTRHDPLTIDVR